MEYLEFLRSKIEVALASGFDVSPDRLNPALKPHQRDAVIWALHGGRRGYTIELNDAYFRDAVGYLEAEEELLETTTLFDLLEGGDRDGAD